MAGAEHAAPGLVAAIHFQLKRVLLHLLTSDTENSVAVEAPWDVAVLDEKGNLVKAEEDKNSIARVSQLADRHEGLWKSLKNYTAAFVEGRLSGGASVLTICTNVEIGNCWAAQFIGRTWEETDAWVKGRVRELMKLGRSPSEAIKPHFQYLTDHVSELESVVQCLEVIDGQAVTKDGETSKEIHRLLRAATEDREIVLQSVLGWIEEYAAEHIVKNEPAIIPVAAFNTRYREELNRSRQTRLLRRLEKDFAEALTPDRRKIHVGDMFQRQLKWVGLDRSPAIVEQAMEDFLKYEVAVTAYAEDGNIARKQFQDREGEVPDRWKVIFNQECFTVPVDNEAKAALGRQVYQKSSSLDVPIQGFGSCETYLTRGALQHLANAPNHEPRVGWHPEYKALAKQHNGAA